MKLTTREKLFLFEIAYDESSDFEPTYSPSFAEIGLSQTEFDELNASRRLRLAKMRLLQRAWRKFDKRLRDIEATQAKEKEFKRTVLPILYNNPECYPELSEIQKLAISVLDSFFAKQELSLEERDLIYKLSESHDYQTALVAEALEELLHGELDIRQCASCGKIFAPTKQGHGQKYCSNACNVREYKKRKKGH